MPVYSGEPKHIIFSHFIWYYIYFLYEGQEIDYDSNLEILAMPLMHNASSRQIFEKKCTPAQCNGESLLSLISGDDDRKCLSPRRCQLAILLIILVEHIATRVPNEKYQKFHHHLQLLAA
jgi:hypothetical protein